MSSPPMAAPSADLRAATGLQTLNQQKRLLANTMFLNEVCVLFLAAQALSQQERLLAYMFLTEVCVLTPGSPHPETRETSSLHVSK